MLPLVAGRWSLESGSKKKKDRQNFIFFYFFYSLLFVCTTAKGSQGYLVAIICIFSFVRNRFISLSTERLVVGTRKIKRKIKIVLYKPISFSSLVRISRCAATVCLTKVFSSRQVFLT